MAGSVAFVPYDLDPASIAQIQSALSLEISRVSFGGSRLIGCLLAGNSKGLAIADIATEDEIDQLTSFGDVIVMESGVNAAGNLLVANESGAIVAPTVPEEGQQLLSDVLGVEVLATSIAGNETVGSVLAANDQGAVVHPDILREDALAIENVLGVPLMVGTVAFGSPFVGAGLVCSNSGALVGERTTGPEMNRIEDALGLI